MYGEEAMPGSKVYVRKPLRRYERDFEAEMSAEETAPEEEPTRPAVFTDITSDPNNQGASVQARQSRQADSGTNQGAPARNRNKTGIPGEGNRSGEQ